MSAPTKRSASPTVGEILEWRALYAGDREATVAAFTATYQADGLDDGLGVNGRDVEVVNELRPVIDRRIGVMPVAFAYAPAPVPEPAGGAPSGAGDAPEGPPGAASGSPADDVGAALAVALNAWAASEVNDSGQDLYAVFGEATEDQEIDSLAAFVLGRDTRPGGSVSVHVRDVTQMQTVADPVRPRQVSEYRFRWVADETGAGGAPETVEYEEVITRTSRALRRNGQPYGEPETFNLTRPPVVLMPSKRRKGSLYGESGVAVVKGAYLSFLWKEYLRNLALKYAAGPVYCPEDAEAEAAFLPDQNGNRPDLRIRSGRVFPVRIKQANGAVNLAAFEAARNDALKSLRRIGEGSEDSEGTDLRSGKAMQMRDAGLVELAQRKADLGKIALRNIARLYAEIVQFPGYDPLADAPVIPEFPNFEAQDPAENRERSRLWLDAKGDGAVDTLSMLEGWQREGMIPRDTNLAALAERIEASQAQAEERRAQEMADRLALAEQSAPAGGEVTAPSGEDPQAVEAP